MKTNRQWVEQNGCYELHFAKFEKDEIVLKFVPDKEDKTCFWYVSEDLKVEYDCEYFDSLEEAKEEFELKYEAFLEDQAEYYESLLEQWNEVVQE
ncbi:MAG: hypothetical protein J6A19_04955 [Oscillospiraceae bacterium]|nr:hypothetical protein [Oscillospiraceae bacterium]